MKTAFVHPPLDRIPSGGQRYNQAMLAAAADGGVPLVSAPWVVGQPLTLAGFDAVLWDSLFVPALADIGELLRQPARRGLLVHWLPDSNPLLNAAERQRWRQQFDAAVRPMTHLLATGVGIAAALRARYPTVPVALCEPGVDDAFLRARTLRRTDVHAPGPVRLVTVAHLLPAKRQRELLELLARIDAEWCWYLIGSRSVDAGYAAGVFDRAAALGLDDRILHRAAAGPQQLAAWLAEMDVFVTASAFESYGMALAEAVAMGLPAISTDVGAASELIAHGESGWLIDLAEPETAVAALTRLITEPALRAQYHQAAWARPVRCWTQALAEFSRAL